ncbi:peptidyl-prolyl cis-trans isomerase [Sporichthya sp.]|uniref:peptidyl-prolyl cis-trans isomerase n=1 Tax=Sporichthya sp. TaxID=65475 RepID=UPI0017E76E93|nr:peptidyl-prolyl cis-trans isomerase [Sporichthya sp.]MBA3742353.1 peptidyl-prolyl cis-trans isomerase [Sporichthya sp.]
MSGRTRVRSARYGVAGALALTLALSGCGGGGGAPAIAANVEGIEITSAQVDELFKIFENTDTGQADLQGVDGVKAAPEQIRRTALSYRIKIAFVEFLAKREGAQVSDSADENEVYDELAEIGSLKFAGYKGEDLQVAARIEKISKAIAAKLLPEVSVSREELQAAYDARPEIVGASFRATTGIAFMDSPESAAALRKALAKGTDFKTATDALSGTVGADTVDINPITPIQAEIVEQVRKLEPGESSEPTRYDLGDVTVYTVLYQVKRKDLPALTLEDAKPELTQIVVDSKRFQVFDDWLRKQYLAANITVDKYYGKWDPTLRAVI